MDEEARAVLRAVNESHQEVLREMMEGNRLANAERDRRTVRAMAGLQRRYVRTGWLLILMVVAVGAAATAGLLGLNQQQDRLDDLLMAQQEQRRTALLETCRRENANARALRSFVRRAAPDLEPLAARQFRVQRSCVRYTDAVMNGRRLPSPVPQGARGG